MRVVLSIKIALISLLLICLLDMPYGYYQFVRVTCLVGFGYLAYIEYQDKNIVLFLLFLIGSILFNPVVKLNLGRQVWQIADVLFAIILLGATFRNIKSFMSKS